MMMSELTNFKFQSLAALTMWNLVLQSTDELVPMCVSALVLLVYSYLKQLNYI